MKSKTINKFFAFLLVIVMAVTITACTTATQSNTGYEITKATAVDLTKDREGNSITLPKDKDKILSMGPSNTEILVSLGFSDNIIATDTYSENVDGIKSDIPMFSMKTPDGEQIVNLQPDIIFVTGMSKASGEDPFKLINDSGICVIYIPSASSLNGIKEDIRYIAAVMGAESLGDKLVLDMEKEIADIKKIGDTVTDKKSVYFEISAAPYMYSFGKLTFLNEMIELIGAKNIFAEQDVDWMTVADEAVANTNPDIILTSVNYIENPTDEIKSRPGWDSLSAVQNNDVYYIDTDTSNRPNQNIIKALKEMAKAVYPDKYN